MLHWSSHARMEPPRQRSDLRSGRQLHVMPANAEACVISRTVLPPEIWAAIIRLALRAEGRSLAAWERLSRVSSTWRAVLKGMSEPAIAHDQELHIRLQSARCLHVHLLDIHDRVPCC